jgi:hypothetical protein
MFLKIAAWQLEKEGAVGKSYSVRIFLRLIIVSDIAQYKGEINRILGIV